MRVLGAQIINTPREGGMPGASAKAEELRTSIPGAVSLEQFKNQANPLAHYETTDPEIYRNLDGNIDCLVAGAGTGGTYTGVVRYLKEQNPEIKGIPSAQQWAAASMETMTSREPEATLSSTQ